MSVDEARGLREQAVSETTKAAAARIAARKARASGRDTLRGELPAGRTAPAAGQAGRRPAAAVRPRVPQGGPGRRADGSRGQGARQPETDGLPPRANPPALPETGLRTGRQPDQPAGRAEPAGGTEELVGGTPFDQALTAAADLDHRDRLGGLHGAGRQRRLPVARLRRRGGSRAGTHRGGRAAGGHRSRASSPQTGPTWPGLRGHRRADRRPRAGSWPSRAPTRARC